MGIGNLLVMIVVVEVVEKVDLVAEESEMVTGIEEEIQDKDCNTRNKNNNKKLRYVTAKENEIPENA
jgi:hypothetical protein